MSDVSQVPEEPDLPIYTDVNKVPLNLLEQLSGHWRSLSEQKRRQHDVNTRQILAGQIFTIVAIAAFGFFVDQNQDTLLLFGSTLVLYPSLVDLLVSNSASLVANLHHEIDTQEGSKLLYAMKALSRSIIVSTLASSIVGLVAGAIGWWLFSATFISTLQLAVLAGAMTGLVGLPFMVIVTFMARSLKSNPDDVTPPVENTIFSVVVLVMIGVASRMLS